LPCDTGQVDQPPWDPTAVVKLPTECHRPLKVYRRAREITLIIGRDTEVEVFTRDRVPVAERLLYRHAFLKQREGPREIAKVVADPPKPFERFGNATLVPGCSRQGQLLFMQCSCQRIIAAPSLPGAQAEHRRDARAISELLIEGLTGS
jgi:hypothetical protein